MNQRGYSLLLSLFVLLGFGGVWVAGVTQHRITHAADQTLALSLARTALISYAVNYIDHYGAQGAGIGHLPCPDTDKPDHGHLDTWHRDGPNPPCAKQAVEQGWLPRHVTVHDGRYHFHTRSQQRLLYAVSGHFVNNPLGRIVNPSTDSEFSVGRYTDVIAVLGAPPLDRDLVNSGDWLSPETLESSGTAYSLIRKADVLAPTVQRVGDWLISQLNKAMDQRCALTIETGVCAIAEHGISYCNSDQKYVLLHWLNTESAAIDCQTHNHNVLATSAMLEEVPSKRHWFMRNEWFDFVGLSFDQNCLSGAASECRFVLLPKVDDDVQLNVHLQPVANVTEE